MLVKELLQYLNEQYPFDNASSFDIGKVGLQFGNIVQTVTKVIVCLDITFEVIDEALEKGCEVIIAHHPFLFSPLLNLDYQTPLGEKLIKILSNRLNIINLHTNYDVGDDGMNYQLALMLGLENIRFNGTEVANNTFLRYGNTPSTTFGKYIEHVKKTFGYLAVKVVGSLDHRIEKVGIVAGSGDICLNEAYHLGCDLFITGEVKHHMALQAQERGICLIELHHAVESNFTDKLVKKLSSHFSNIEFISSKSQQDPFKIII